MQIGERGMNLEAPQRPRTEEGEPVPDGGAERGRQLRGIDLILVLALTAGLYLLVGRLIGDPTMGILTVVSILALQSAIPMAVVYLVVIRARGLAWADIGFRAIPTGWALRAFLVALAVLPAMLLVNLATQTLTGRPFRNPQLEFLAPAGFSWEGLVGMLVVVAVIVPIVEETVFRGLLYGWLRSRLGVAAAVILSSLIFAFGHGILMLVPALAVTGLVLALVYEKSGSLWPPIIVHGAINAAMTIALYAALAADVQIN
jgi:uncharacterized protein